MTLLETIGIRLFEQQNSHLLHLLFEQMNQGLTGLRAPQAASLLCDCGAPGTWSVQLTWRGENLPHAKTALGRHLAESVRPFGLVHHSVWLAFADKQVFTGQPSRPGGQYEA